MPERISWKPHKFTIAIDGFFHNREALVDGIMCADGFGIHTQERYSVVSHLASGKRLASFTAIGAALRFVEHVAQYARSIDDWHSPECTVGPEIAALFNHKAEVCC